jgi:flagellar biosynthetic protein FliR
MVRIGCFIYIAPFFSQSNTPAMMKIGLTFFVSVLIFGFVDFSEVGETGTFGYAIIVLKEAMTGLLIGFAANICTNIITFAGNIVDMDIGLAMAKEFDPTTNTQVSITGNLYQYFILLLLIATSMDQYFLRAIVDTYEVIPINGQNFQWDSLLTTITTYMADSFVIAFRIILPVFACIMILNCILGIMAKVSPQMNMFAVGMQLKVMVGLSVIFLTIFLIPNIANFIFNEIKTMVGMVIESMYE